MSEEQPLEALVPIPSGQLVRVRFLGAGPAVVLLHESPRSGAALLPLAQKLADRFTCVMLDTPGFGLSDPIRMSRPEIPDFADVAVAVAEALELGPVPFYGAHTGAAIAADAALRSPETACAAVLDGYAMFSEAERDELLAAYLRPFRHSLDGTHVAWLWCRVRDQFTAFPWHRVADAGRLPFGPPPIETLQAVVDDFLLADDEYRVGYSAAFRYDHLHPIRTTKTPIHVGTREDDLLFPHLKHATEIADCVTVEAFSADRAVWAERIGALLGEHTRGRPAVDATELLRRALSRQGDRRIVNTSVGPVVMRLDGDRDAPPVVLLHDTPGGMADLDHLAQRLATTHRVVRLNLPGLGASRLKAGASPSVEIVTQGVREGLEAVGASAAPIVAAGASLPAALPLDRPLIALDPWPQVAASADPHLPDLSPRWDGAHLFAAFHWARDYDLYKPWHHRVNAESRMLGGERDMLRLNHRFRAVVLGGATGVEVTRALYAADASDALRARSGDSAALIYDTDPDHEALRAWATPLLGASAVRTAPRDERALADAIRGALQTLSG